MQLTDSSPVHPPEAPTDLATGLTEEEAAQRLEQYGPNEVVAVEDPEWTKIASRFLGLIPMMMLVSALLSATVVTKCVDDDDATVDETRRFLQSADDDEELAGCECKELRDWISFGLLIFELNLIVFVDYLGEASSGNAIKELKKMSAPSANVKRGGTWLKLPVAQLVPGDIIGLVIGASVPADGVLVAEGAPENYAPLKIDASSLTGEPLPETKKVGDTVMSGTTVLSGELDMQVTATGAESSMGQAMALIQGVGEQGGKLKAMLKTLARTIALVAGIVCIALFLVLVARDGIAIAQAIKLSFVILVAVLPVAMPVVVTTGLAVGALELSKEQAIVQRLSAIEEMAGMDILCSDKTGTLTLGKMQVIKDDCVPFGEFSLDDLLLTTLLASRRENTDAIDTAVCKAFGDPRAAVAGFEELRFAPFNPVDKKTVAHVRARDGGRPFLASKGAPPIMNLLPGIDQETAERANTVMDEKAARGYKTLAICRSDDETPESATWTMVGYISLMDPPRSDTEATIVAAQERGVEVKMITGDQRKIAVEVAHQLHMGTHIFGPDVWLPNAPAVDRAGGVGNLAELANGFAGVHPEHKYKVVEALQAAGHTVGMTGDGVNDAPALAVANVGIAVADATDAARGAADIVLTREGLSTIVSAINRSRQIFRRLEAYITYRLASSFLILGFFTLSIVACRFDFPTWTLILLSIVNDFTVMATSKDNVRSSPKPLYWDVPKLALVAGVIGGLCILQCFLLLYLLQTERWHDEIGWLAKFGMHDMPDCELVAVIYMDLGICIQLNIFSARNKRFFFQTSEAVDAAPLPSPILCAPVCGALLAATLIGVYWPADVALGGGNPMKGCGWGPAAAVWVWCILWFFVIEIAKVLTHAVYGDKSVDELFMTPLDEKVLSPVDMTDEPGEHTRMLLDPGKMALAALAIDAGETDAPPLRLPKLPKASEIEAVRAIANQPETLKLLIAMREHIVALESRLEQLDGRHVAVGNGTGEAEGAAFKMS